MRFRLYSRCMPALLVAGPALALPNEGPSPERVTPAGATPPAEASARRAEPRPSAAFLEAAMLMPQGEQPAAPVTQAAPPQQSQPHKEPTLHVFVFYEDRELDELTIDPDEDNTGPLGTNDIDVFDIDQSRAGLGMAFGKQNVRGYFKVFADTLGDEPTEFEGFGLGGGVAGSPAIAEVNADTNVTLPYRFELTGAFDDTDNTAGGVAGDLVYIENRLEVGVGINWQGLHPSLGVQASSLVGFLSDDITDTSNSNDYLLTGFNPGFYAGVAYKHPDFPVFVDLRFFGGDVTGWTGVLGASF